MTEILKAQTSEINGQHWSAAARDWAEIQEQTALNAYVAALKHTGVTAETHYLDIGCGAGMALQLATQKGAKVAGIDAALAMLEIAKQRVPDGDIRHGDIEELPFADDVFDVVTGFNSFQYAGNPIIALAEAKRVCKPNGKVLIMTWGEPKGMEAASLVAALKPLMPPLPKGAAGPFALSDEQKLREFAADAGLIAQDVFDVECPFIYANEQTAIKGMMSAGVNMKAIENTSREAVVDAYTKAFAPFKQTDGSYYVKATFRCLVAQA